MFGPAVNWERQWGTSFGAQSLPQIVVFPFSSLDYLEVRDERD